jgi:hypothetical protein
MLLTLIDSKRHGKPDISVIRRFLDDALRFPTVHKDERRLSARFGTIREIHEFLKWPTKKHQINTPFTEPSNMAGLDRIIEGLGPLSCPHKSLLRDLSDPQHEYLFKVDLTAAWALIPDKDAAIETFKMRLETPNSDSRAVIDQLGYVLKSKRDLSTVISLWQYLQVSHGGHQGHSAMASAFDFVGGWSSPKDGLVALIEKTRSVSGESGPEPSIKTEDQSPPLKLQSEGFSATKDRGDKRQLLSTDLPRAYIKSRYYTESKESIELWGILIDTYPEDLGLEEELASVLKARRDPELEITVWKNRLYSHPRNWRFQLQLHQACRGSLDEEVKCFTELVSKYPNILGLQAYLERVYPTHENEINGWQALIVQHPSEETLRKKLVNTYARSNDIDLAISGWVKVINQVPSSTALQNQLAASLAAKRDSCLSITVWRELVQKHPNEPTLRERLAAAYAAHGAEAALSLYLTVRYPTSVMQKIQACSEIILDSITPFVREGEDFEVSAGYDILPEDINHVAEGCEDFFTGIPFPYNCLH